MDVKAESAESAGERPSGCLVADTTAELLELLSVMPRVFRGLKRGSESSGHDTVAGFAALFKGGELGPRHVPVLVVLALEGPLSVGDLARRLGLSVATVSLMAGELARAGLVERAEDDHDRRRTLLSISERHRRRLGPLVDNRIAPVRRALERMSPEIRQAFLAGWRVLAEEIDRSP
jgi:DNA-binding MarR family transcriptional regulator